MKFFPVMALGVCKIRASFTNRPRIPFFAALLIITFFLSVSVWRGLSVSAATESIQTVSSTDCLTPQATWQLGQSACARVTNGPIGSRRFVWLAPDGTVARVAPVTSDPATDTYAIPTTGPFAQVGTWKVS